MEVDQKFPGVYDSQVVEFDQPTHQLDDLASLHPEGTDLMSMDRDEAIRNCPYLAGIAMRESVEAVDEVIAQRTLNNEFIKENPDAVYDLFGLQKPAPVQPAERPSSIVETKTEPASFETISAPSQMAEAPASTIDYSETLRDHIEVDTQATVLLVEEAIMVSPIAKLNVQDSPDTRAILDLLSQPSETSGQHSVEQVENSTNNAPGIEENTALTKLLERETVEQVPGFIESQLSTPPITVETSGDDAPQKPSINLDTSSTTVILRPFVNDVADRPSHAPVMPRDWSDAEIKQSYTEIATSPNQNEDTIDEEDSQKNHAIDTFQALLLLNENQDSLSEINANEALPYDPETYDRPAEESPMQEGNPRPSLENLKEYLTNPPIAARASVLESEPLRSTTNNPPLERILLDFAANMSERTRTDSGSNETIHIWNALQELHVAIDISLQDTKEDISQPTNITLEITEKILTVLTEIGYDEPAKALIAFAEKYGTKETIRIFQQLSQLVYDLEHKEVLSNKALASLATADNTDDTYHYLGKALVRLVRKLHMDSTPALGPINA